MNHIDLFSGIGGFALAAKWAGFKTVAFVEIEPYAQEIIKQDFGAVADADCQRRQQERRGSLGDEAAHEGRAANGDHVAASHGKGRCPRLFGDIRDFDGTHYRGATLLTGGFPCQPFSFAGKRAGKEDDRFLWPEMLRVISQARPTWIIGENVAGIIGMELDRCISDLEGQSYAVQPLVIPACAVDAKHRRDRVWIVGHAEGERPGEVRRLRCDKSTQWVSGASEAVADAASVRQLERAKWERRGTQEQGRMQQFESVCRWFPEPDVGRVANGIPNRVDRLKGLGNAIVPQVAYQIIKRIAAIENQCP